MRSTFIRLFCLMAAMLVTLDYCSAASAQTVSPATAPAAQSQTVQAGPAEQEKEKARRTVRRTATPPRPARVTMVKDQEPVAPQVVTIVHRLSGVKMLRYLLRESGERTVATIDPQSVTGDVHASIIAGWALEDGKTIAARLPQVAAEMEVQRFTFAMPGKVPGGPETPGPEVWQRMPRAPRMQPDLTVMTQDGRTFRARYIGLDGLTGLSVLQLAQPTGASTTETSTKKVSVGESVQLFAPERVSAESTPSTIFVRIGKTDATVAKAPNVKAQPVERLTLNAGKLSADVLGGVACDEKGNTLGIVEMIQGNVARLLTADTIRAAARRVLEQQTSVPGPLLGVRGEAVDVAARKALLEFGWNEHQFDQFIRDQVGILLTSVLPGTPAALAKLHPGDIIIRVNDKDVKGAEEFSAMLTRAGSGEDVRFLVQRPTAPAPVSFDVKLGGAYQPFSEWQFEMPVVPRTPGGLKTLGVEYVMLSGKYASQWGGSGLLVVAIEPDSIAAKVGLKERDVIESIDGRAVGRGAWTFVFQFNPKEKHVLSVVREREKKQIVIDPVE